MVYDLTEKVVPRVSAKDAVVAIGIDQLPEILIFLNQGLHILGRVPVMHIVVSETMTEQQRTMQQGCPGNGIHLVVTRLILLRCTHVAFRID